MNGPRTSLDGLAMALLFNAVVGVGFLLRPQAYSTMFPREIRKAVAPYVDKRGVKKRKLLLCPLYLLLFALRESARRVSPPPQARLFEKPAPL